MKLSRVGVFDNLRRARVDFGRKSCADLEQNSDLPRRRLNNARRT